MIFGFAILATALMLSFTAAYYSVMGLTAIFAAATIPVIIMGVTLELGKIVATVWMHNNWHRASWAFKSYLIPAVVFLMLLTSMGIFGFLSKANLDQSVPADDIQAQVRIFDEKIQTQRENIDADRRALKQMDEAVDQVMGRSDDSRGADKAVALRRSQARERANLQNEIAAAQKIISDLQSQRAPIASQSRKMDAEVGPIRYIAAFIYGDNPDANLLGRAVRWVIIMIVLVFDPLALCLILAANKQMEWAREDNKAQLRHEAELARIMPDPAPPAPEPDVDLLSDEQIEQIQATVSEIPEPEIAEPAEIEPDSEVVTLAESETEELGECPKCETPLQNAPGIGPFCPNKSCDVLDGPFSESGEDIVFTYVPENPEPEVAPEPEITAEPKVLVEPETDDVDSEIVDIAEFWHRGQIIARALDQDEEIRRATEANALLSDIDLPEYDLDLIAEDEPEMPPASYEEVVTQALEESIPEPVVEPIAAPVPEAAPGRNRGIMVTGLDIQADNLPATVQASNAAFGSQFPQNPARGDVYLRIDYLPNRLYKYNGTKWMDVDKNQTDIYAYDEDYIRYLINQIDQGSYDPDLLTAMERELIAQYLERQN
jgi:hypothetical protein